METAKVWGTTRLIEGRSAASLHRAEVNAGFRCSRHVHHRKWNGFFVESGELHVRVYQPSGDEDVTVLRAGAYLAVPPGIWHRFECIANTVLFELYWLDDLGEDIERADEGGPL